MQRKNPGKELPTIIKRILLQYSFHQFKERLEYMCEIYKCKLILVNEALTTKSCSCCGSINDKVGKSEEYNCPNCSLKLDRDVNSARNILIKGMTILKG